MKEDDYMYPWEIKKFIEERNYYIGGDDLLKVISPVENPQLKGIEYKPFENRYYMWEKEMIIVLLQCLMKKQRQRV